MKIFPVVLPLALVFAACGSIEKPAFQPVKKAGNVEIRKYGGQIEAQTTVQGEFNEVGNEGFRRLASYIFAKKRDGKQKIAMTAPVKQKLDLKDKNLTRLVKSGASSYTISFIMPDKYTLEQLPKPEDNRVKLVQVEPRYMAVVRYKGGWSKSNYEENEKKLMAALNENSLKAKGNVIWARYNSPFTPWFLRTNEVMVEVEPLQ